MAENVESIVAEIPALRRYAATLSRNRAAADDLVQDAIERAIEKFHLYEPGTKLRYWLQTIMRNIFRDQYRKHKKLDAITVELDDNVAAQMPPNQIASLIHKDLVREIDALKPAYRELVLLVGAHGVSYEDAALLTGVPLGTVRSRLFRARNTLLSKVEGEEAVRAGHRSKKRRVRSQQAAVAIVASSPSG